MDHWYEVRFEEVTISAIADLQVNQPFTVTAAIQLGALTAADVQVELYQGTVAVDGEIHAGVAVPMAHQGQDAKGRSLYGLDMEYTASGLQGLSLRILPQHPSLSSYDPKLVLWADPDSVQVIAGVAASPVAD